jgi:hypothetical protein
MEKCAPDGTVDAICEIMSFARAGRNTTGVFNEDAQILFFRGNTQVNGAMRGLSVFPDRLRNWGLKAVPYRNNRMWSGESVLQVLEKGHNWWWESFNYDERLTVLRRYRALLKAHIRDHLTTYFRSRFPRAHILAIAVNGSYLFGKENNYAGDVDVTIFAEDTGLNAVVDIEIEVPKLKNALGKQGGRLRRNAVGIGIVERGALQENAEDPVLLQVSASLYGALPLYGEEILDDVPIPAFDLICQAHKLLEDGEKAFFASNDKRRLFMRLDESRRVALLASKLTGADWDSEPYRCIEGNDDPWIFIKNMRQNLAKSFFALVSVNMVKYSLEGGIS